jgi:hypothetical protein
MTTDQPLAAMSQNRRGELDVRTATSRTGALNARNAVL